MRTIHKEKKEFNAIVKKIRSDIAELKKLQNAVAMAHLAKNEPAYGEASMRLVEKLNSMEA